MEAGDQTMEGDLLAALESRLDARLAERFDLLGAQVCALAAAVAACPFEALCSGLSSGGTGPTVTTTDSGESRYEAPTYVQRTPRPQLAEDGCESCDASAQTLEIASSPSSFIGQPIVSTIDWDGLAVGMIGYIRGPCRVRFSEEDAERVSCLFPACKYNLGPAQFRCALGPCLDLNPIEQHDVDRQIQDASEDPSEANSVDDESCSSESDLPLGFVSDWPYWAFSDVVS